MPSPRRARRKRRRGRRIAAVAVILIAVIIAAALVESGRSHHGAPLPASLPENLQLSGVISGRFTAATATQGMTSTFPSGQGSNGLGRINATACVQNASDGWEVDLYGQVGAHPMSLSFDAQDPSSNDMADTYVGTHELDNNANFGGLVAFYWGSVDLEYPVIGSATLVVNHDSRSGTMNVKLTDVPSGGKKLETITGSWRCA